MSEELIPEELAAARKRTRSTAIYLSLTALCFAAGGVLSFLRFKANHDTFEIIFVVFCALAAATFIYRSITLFVFLAREARLKISEQVEHLNASFSEG